LYPAVRSHFVRFRNCLVPLTFIFILSPIYTSVSASDT